LSKAPVLWALVKTSRVNVKYSHNNWYIKRWQGRPNMKISNLPEANKYIREEYREGWTLLF